MTIDLTTPIKDYRMTRTVIGQPPSMDISTIFECGEIDFLTSEPITDDNFDDDTVIYIQKLGFTRRKSLLQIGVTGIQAEHMFNDIYGDQLVYKD